MRALVQRVNWAEVEVDGKITGWIQKGLLVYVGVAPRDSAADADWLADKVANLRVFEDGQDRLNLSVLEVGGGVLAISNFTLLADARKGRRPAFVGAAPADLAERLHELFLDALAGTGVSVATGVFGAKMAVRSESAGPVNVIVDSPSPQ